MTVATNICLPVQFLPVPNEFCPTKRRVSI